MAFSYTVVFTILLLHLSQGTGGRNVTFTIVNKCSHTIWPAIGANPRLETTGFELPNGSSRAFEAPTGLWLQLWGRTGCTFDDSGVGSCATGDCSSGQMECSGVVATAATLAQFSLQSNYTFYHVSLVSGYNLPLLIEVSGGEAGQCASIGCVEDMNQMCPPELGAEGGGACRSACIAFNTPEHCCTGKYGSRSTCRPSKYSELFKSACPKCESYAFDANYSTVTCTAAADYVVTFCPSDPSSSDRNEGYNAQTGKGMPPMRSPGYTPQSFSYYHQNGNGKNTIMEIVLVVALSITGVIIVSIIIRGFLRQQHSTSSHNQECNQDVENFLLHGSLTPKRYKYSEIEKITKSFSNKLGQGGYGSVYKGMLDDGCLVAVKVLMETDSNGEEFINEVATISRTSHVNIVNLLGFCYDGNKRALVYEFMPNKSLDKFLINNQSTTNPDCCLDLEKLYKIAVGIAKGLEYLHAGCSTRIVHFDIKPQNILLDEDFCPKISDFGLAKLCKKKQSILSVLGTRGTIGYIAPEIFLRNFEGASHRSDVYSYGMMVLEMAGTKKVVETEAIQSCEDYFPDKIYEQIMIDFTKKLDGILIEEEEEIRGKMFLVGFWCIQTNPSDRPSMSKVVEMLEGSLQSIQIPPKPFLYYPNLPGKEISSSFSTNVGTSENSDQE